MGIGYAQRMKNYGNKVFPWQCTPKQQRRLRKKINKALKNTSSVKAGF